MPLSHFGIFQIISKALQIFEAHQSKYSRNSGIPVPRKGLAQMSDLYGEAVRSFFSFLYGSKFPPGELQKMEVESLSQWLEHIVSKNN